MLEFNTSFWSEIELADIKKKLKRDGWSVPSEKNLFPPEGIFVTSRGKYISLPRKIIRDGVKNAFFWSIFKGRKRASFFKPLIIKEIVDGHIFAVRERSRSWWISRDSHESLCSIFSFSLTINLWKNLLFSNIILTFANKVVTKNYFAYET